jgi:hypothetical protein
MQTAARRVCSVGLSLILLAAAASAQVAKGVAAVYDNLANGSISPSAMWVDASQFTNLGALDMCQSIAAAIASLPVPGTTTAGAVIDARNFPLSASQTYLACSVNPFELSGNPNSVALVAAGNSAGTTPGSAGGVLLLPGAVISTSAPWLIPLGWSIFGQGGKVTVLAPSGSAYVPASAGRISTTAGNVIVGGAGGTGWANTILGSILLGCTPTSCVGSPTNAVVVGLVTNWVSTVGLYLGTGAQATLSSSGTTGQTNYSFYTPLMAWATTVAGTTSGALGTITTGSVIQDVGLDCSIEAGGTLVPGCVPFWDQYGQERSQLKRVRITNFGGQTTPVVAGLGIGIYTSNAQNGGPFDDIQMATANILSNNTCVEVGGNGVGGQPSMRGIRGLTCTGPSSPGSAAGVGVDINTQNFSLSDAHFENFTYGVQVGSITSARGIDISDVTGGGSSSAVDTVNVVNIGGTCAAGTATGGSAPCQSFATSDVNVSAIYQPNAGTSGYYSLVDSAGSGHSFTDATIGVYDLGDGSSPLPSGTNNRPILTTSSTFGSSPNFVTMTAGQPITAVQGGGTLVQMSTGTVTSGDLAKFDSSGNTVDAGIAPGSVPWSGLTSATGALTLSNAGNATTFDQTSAVNWTWANTTTATSATTNASPGLNIAANYWTGSASAADSWSMQSSLASGTNGTSTLTFAHTGSTGLALVAFPGIGQTAASSYGGTCSVPSAGGTCTVPISHSYTTPVCIVTKQVSSGTPSTGMCSVSGTTVTIIGSTTGTYGVLVFGNPN